MKRIGILGGTFDPPHIGHLLIAEEVRIALQLDEIWFMPANEPPHKEKAMTTGNDRITMLNKAIESNPAFKVNNIELERMGKSFTFDTMKVLKNDYPHTVFYFIIGADMVEYLPYWEKIDELVKLVKFVGVKRPGFILKTPYPLIEIDIPLMEISSSLIRDRLMKKKTVHYLIPESVYSFIREERLYESR